MQSLRRFQQNLGQFVQVIVDLSIIKKMAPSSRARPDIETTEQRDHRIAVSVLNARRKDLLIVLVHSHNTSPRNGDNSTWLLTRREV